MTAVIRLVFNLLEYAEVQYDPPDAHFDFIGLHDPSAPASGSLRDAIPLTPTDCELAADAYVATTSNPGFRAANGFPGADSRLKNLRSNEVPKIALPDGTRLMLPPAGLLPPPFPPTSSLPASPLTLGEFRNVSGDMRVRCRRDGTARVRIRVAGYDHNALLTVWGIWLATPPGAPAPALVPLPLGGVPNILPITRQGTGVFERELGYCPQDPQNNGDQLLVVDIAEHWDGNAYGAVPDLPLATRTFLPNPTDPSSAFDSVIGAGIVTVNRGVFNVTLARWE